MGYSLWLVPANDSVLCQKLTSIIESMNCSFVPHVTLTTKIPLSKSIDDIRLSLLSYFDENGLPVVQINQVDTDSQFFKRIFLRCEKTVSLLSLAQFSTENFVEQSFNYDQWLEMYDPHISLIYARPEDCDDEKLISRIDQSTLIGQQFVGGQIQLVDTTDELSKWKTVLQFDIQHEQQS